MRRKTVREFAAEKRLAQCPVCNLPKEALKGVEESRRNRQLAPLSLIADWLKREWEQEITTAQLLSHLRGGHHLKRLRS